MNRQYAATLLECLCRINVNYRTDWSHGECRRQPPDVFVSRALARSRRRIGHKKTKQSIDVLVIQAHRRFSLPHFESSVIMVVPQVCRYVKHSRYRPHRYCMDLFRAPTNRIVQRSHRYRCVAFEDLHHAAGNSRLAPTHSERDFVDFRGLFVKFDIYGGLSADVPSAPWASLS
jgi:hypothetical protein